VFCGIYLQGIKVFHVFCAPFQVLENLPDLLVLSKVVRQAMGEVFFFGGGWVKKLNPKSNGWTLKMIVLNRCHFSGGVHMLWLRA